MAQRMYFLHSKPCLMWPLSVTALPAKEKRKDKTMAQPIEIHRSFATEGEADAYVQALEDSLEIVGVDKDTVDVSGPYETASNGESGNWVVELRRT